MSLVNQVLGDKRPRVIGVDSSTLGHTYDDVLRTSLRADPDVLLICHPEPGERETAFAERAHMAGVSVSVLIRREQAPADTYWLPVPLA
jgi:hypothetical protein